MALASKTFRIFVSSTFSDLKAERNCLQHKVFPRLRAFCRQRGVRMQAIGLRWGVSQEASLDQQTMNICLDEIDRCQELTPRPNFVVLLGDRYGWRPLPPQIPADEFDQILPVLSAEDKALVCWDETKQTDYTVWTQENQNLAGGFHRKGWYRKDENALPAQYILQPRIIEFPKGVTEEEKQNVRKEKAIEWQGIEERLFSALATAIDKLKWPANDPRCLKYVASATHQEIAAGALKVEKPEDKVFCFFREIQGAPSGSLTDTFIESDPTARVQLTELKNKLTHLLPPSNIKEYTSVWVGNGLSQEHLNHLADDVFEILRDAIQREIDHPTERALKAGEVHIPPDKHLDNEGLTQCEFAEERVQIFVVREDALADIANYLGRDDSYPFGLSGAGGTGKSALIAKSVERALQNYPDAAVVYRFIGATPGSSNGRSLLEGLCREISRRYGAEDSTIPATYRGLVPEFTRRLRLAEETRLLLVFIDALDQLSSIEDARNLKWLPANLPQQNVFDSGF